MQEPGGKCLACMYLVRRCLAFRYLASVVSRLALRWAAQQPQTQAMQCAWRNAALLLGPLRSPTQGKPAHHKSVGVHTAGVRVQLVDVQHVQKLLKSCKCLACMYLVRRYLTCSYLVRR
ncbi:hypothetical protein DXV65_02955 [Pseudomonas fluorescens]|nr:hypothetical protein DXV65_02955 [Pseudomonas fluorescens]